MFTCPENDIHSVYLDGELPPVYMAEYESHLAGCEKCRAKLDSLRGLHEKLSADSASITLDSTALEESFRRLITKKSYRKNTLRADAVLTPGKIKSSLKYVVTGAAAAAVMALILPARRTGAPAQDTTAFQPVARTNMVMPQSMPVGAGTESVSLASYLADQRPYYGRGPEFANSSVTMVNSSVPQMGAGMPGFPPQPQMYSPQAYAQSVARRSSLARYNVFGPVPQEAEMPAGNASESQKKGFSFHVSSPLGNISLEIGSGN